MSLLAQIVDSGAFLGIHWHPWKLVGWTGNVIFFSRFVVQWWATEKHKRVVVPNAFWWLSLIGSLAVLAYSISRRDSVFIFAYAFNFIPYIRNLVISHRNAKAEPECASCGQTRPRNAKFCPHCGINLVQGQTIA